MDSSLAELMLRDRRISYAITDRDLRVIEINDPTCTLGVDDGGADPRCARGIGRPLPDLVPEFACAEDALAEILAGTLPRFQLSLVNREAANGQTAYLTLVALPYSDRAGQITGVLHLWQDVTELASLNQRLAQQRNELRLLQEQLKRQNLMLAAAGVESQRLGELKSAFVSVAAHELRTPLTSILGYLEMLLDGDFGVLTDLQRVALDTVQEGARRLNTVANDLLDLARIEAGRIELLLRPVDLSCLLKSVARELAPQFAAKSQRLSLDVAPELPLALCDEARAAQIIGNLLSNANKYTPGGGAVSARLGRAAEDGFLQVAIADTGIGIAPEDQTELFRRFFRARNAETSGASGAGLGLSIAHSLAELHGGRIWFESEPGKGSTFYVTFPITDEPAAASAA